MLAPRRVSAASSSPAKFRTEHTAGDKLFKTQIIRISPAKHGNKKWPSTLFNHHVGPLWWATILSQHDPLKTVNMTETRVQLLGIFGQLPHGPFPQLFNSFFCQGRTMFCLFICWICSQWSTLMDVNSPQIVKWRCDMYHFDEKPLGTFANYPCQALSWSGAYSVSMFVSTQP